VERVWPLNSPWIENIKVMKKGKVRRAKLNYLRKKSSRLKFVQKTAKPHSNITKI